MDTVHRFLFEQLDIRGVLVQLGPAWRSMHERRNYPEPIRDLLGELAAVTTLIGSNLKAPGRLSFQLQGEGPISMLVVDCDEELHIRGMARGELPAETLTTGAPSSAPGLRGVSELLGNGHLVLTLQTQSAEPYQSYVPIEGGTLATMFEHYLALSDQQPARLWLTASDQSACGLLLQKLPKADERDSDGWNRIEQLAQTIRAEELSLPADVLLTRLFSEEDIRLFAPRTASWHCPRDEEKVRNVLLSLGRDEVESMLADADLIEVNDEICGHEYRFGPEILDELFPPKGRLLH